MTNQETTTLVAVDREMQTRFNVLLGHLGYDDWKGELISRDLHGMIVRPFNWGDCTSEHEELVDGYAVGCPCPVCEPNFEHRPSGFKLWWYKHPLRAAESNRILTSEMIEQWIKEVRDAR